MHECRELCVERGCLRPHTIAREAVAGMERLDVGGEGLPEGDWRRAHAPLEREQVAADQLLDKIVGDEIAIRRVGADKLVEISRPRLVDEPATKDEGEASIKRCRRGPSSLGDGGMRPLLS